MNQRMNATKVKLAAILLAGLVFRLALLSLIHNPGLHDPIHYFNLGTRLADGQGFSINYIWHYNSLPIDVAHPVDHWMPLAGVAAGLGISLFGESLYASLIIFLLAGLLLAVLVFLAAKQMTLSDSAALTAAAFSLFLPDLVWASLRTDTTILNALALCLAVLLFNKGLSSGHRLSIVLCGVAAGLAYLTRNDSILLLPVFMFVASLRIIWSRRRKITREALALVLTLLASFILTSAPWLIRNLQELNTLGTAETSRMFFMVEHHDHYAYGIPTTLDSMLGRQTVSDLMAKRVFEFAAALKQIVVSFTVPVFVLVVAGLGYLLKGRDRERLSPILPALVWSLGILLVYPVLLPLKSQAGSFEKAFISILPLFLPFAALSLGLFIHRPFFRRSITAALMVWLAFSSYSFVRQETTKADLYYGSIQILVDTLEDLPDLTGDNRVRVMTQDPYVFSYFGYESIMTPLASRADTLELARRFDIDYLMMPPGRPALDALYLGQESDDRFVLAAHLPEAGAKPFELYRFVHR